MRPPDADGVDDGDAGAVVVVVTGAVVVVVTGAVVVVGTGAVVVVGTGGEVVVAATVATPPFPPPPPVGATEELVDVRLTEDWRSSPNLINWLRPDSDAKTYAWVVAPVTAGVVPLGDAEASMAIIATSAQEVTARVMTFGKRCVVSRLTNLVIEPLSMVHKFTGSNHSYAYGDTTFTQHRLTAPFIRTFGEYFVLKHCAFHHSFDEKGTLNTLS